MSRNRTEWRALLVLAAFSLAGCADELADPPSVADPDPGDAPGALELAESEYGPLGSGPGSPPPTIAPTKVEVGAKAPDFEAMGLDGETVSLSEYLGEQNVVLAFSRAHW